MWYLDMHTEENIIKNMNRFGYLPKIAEYIGESKSGNYKFSYNMKQLVFSEKGKNGKQKEKHFKKITTGQNRI